VPDFFPQDDSVLRRWRAAVRRALPLAADDLIEEIALYLADRWVRARGEGLPDDVADAQIVAELEEWRASRAVEGRALRHRSAWRGGWAADAQSAWRALRLQPLFAGASILLVSVMVLCTSTAFAIAYGVLGRPLPYPRGDHLAVLWQVYRGNQGQISYPDYADLSAAPVFDGRAAISGGRGSLRVGDRIERVNLLAIEAPGFAMLGAVPIRGRLINETDDAQAAMISHRLWRNGFNADPAIVGRSLWLSGRHVTVVGVLPQGFEFELPITRTLKLERHDLWMLFDRRDPLASRRDASTYEALVRLAPGVSLPQAQTAVDTIGSRLSIQHSATNVERSFRVADLKSEITAEARRPLLVACAAAAATLLIGVANLAMLALLRMSQRQSELAIREALGAGIVRLRRQLFTEYLVTSLIGGAAGLLAARALIATLVAAEAAQLPRIDAIRFDLSVVFCGAAVAASIAAVLSALPLRLCRPQALLRAAARVVGRSARRTRQALVAAELALALALAAAGALLGLSLARLFATDPGFTASGVLSLRVSAYDATYPTIDDVEAFARRIVDRLEQLPDVEIAAAGSSLPLSGQTTGTGVAVEGRPTVPGSRQGAGWQFVTPGYFDTLGMVIRHGRDFLPEDRSRGGHVTIVNESLARALFGDANPLGRRVAYGDGDAERDWHEIIGVVADVRHAAMDSPPAPRAYDLLGEHWGRTMYVVARASRADADPLLPVASRVVADLDRDAPVFEIATMDALVRRSTAPYRLAASLAGGVAAGAVALALIGVFAVAGASVQERRRELGVRAALGAAPADLMKLVLSDGLFIASAGGVAGVLCATAAARLLSAQLFGVNGTDVALLIPVVAGAMLLVAAAAVVPAAWRAAHANPLIAMEIE
jgi:predicted permease